MIWYWNKSDSQHTSDLLNTQETPGGVPSKGEKKENSTMRGKKNRVTFDVNLLLVKDNVYYMDFRSEIFVKIS